ncbi:MAG: response regulator transcription factor [Aliarcobacter sp.]
MLDYVLLEKYGKKISVLFVEDDDSLRKEMSFLLGDIFEYIDISADGEEGFNKYTNYYKENLSYYDLIITDIQMPNMNGINLIKNIYKLNPKQKVLVLSAHNESDYLLELVNIGIAQFILKPVDYDNFLEVIFKVSKNIYEKKYKKESKNNSFVKITEDLFWNKELKQLIFKNQIIKLTKKEFLLLDLLLKYPEKVYTNEEIINFLWSGELNLDVQISNLKNLISRLRKKVPDLDIKNNYGFGYSIKLSSV